jgi:hypothetical protein
LGRAWSRGRCYRGSHVLARAREARKGTVEQAKEAAKGAIEQAREAARGVIERARIGAGVEHARRRDERRDAAREHFDKIELAMWTIRNRDADANVRGEAAFDAHNLIARTTYILGDTVEAPRLNELLGALQEGEYDVAAEIWPAVRQAILAQRID